MKLRDRLQRIFDLRWEYQRAVRMKRLINYPVDGGNMPQEIKRIAKEHNRLVFWPMKKLSEVNDE